MPCRAMITDSQRIDRPQLRAGHADGPQQPELAGPLEDRQRQGVGDAEQGDEDGQGEQGVDQAEHLVDRAVAWSALKPAWSSTDAPGYGSTTRSIGGQRLGSSVTPAPACTNTWMSNCVGEVGVVRRHAERRSRRRAGRSP